MANTRFPISTTTQGEYRADVTRDTHNPLDHFRRVIAQQGRPVLDADLNEQTSILLHYLECLAQDLGGPHFGRDAAFELAPVADPNNKLTDIQIKPGRYYVQGMLCETSANGETYDAQPYDSKPAALDLDVSKRYVLYLDVWEEHLTALQRPYIREVALGGPDTATRSRVVWQLRFAPFPVPANGGEPQVGAAEFYPYFLEQLRAADLLRPGRALLRARADQRSADVASPCVTSPAAHYRGPENQLYRVEVCGVDEQQSPRFKWSRENSSVLFAVANANPGKKSVTLADWWKDARFGVREQDWVELIDDEERLVTAPRPLVQVVGVDRDGFEVTLSDLPDVTLSRIEAGHVYLRRWDQRSDQAFVQASLAKNYDDAWIDLEQGIQVQFSLADFAAGDPKLATCRVGDYWLIPARVATGDVEWPEDDAGARLPLPAHGIVHRYAPLAIASIDKEKKWSFVSTRRLVP